MDKTDLCQVSIGQLESQCARGLASHEINVFTSNSSGVRVDHKLKRLKRLKPLKRHFLDQDLKILESSCGGTLRLDPFCDWLLLAAQLLWQFPVASRSWDVLRCAEVQYAAFWLRRNTWPKLQWFLDKAEVNPGDIIAHCHMYIHIESTVYKEIKQ